MCNEDCEFLKGRNINNHKKYNQCFWELTVYRHWALQSSQKHLSRH